MTTCIQLAWLKLLALDGDLAKAEPKTLRYGILSSAGAPPDPQDLRDPVLDGRDHHRLAEYPRSTAPSLTS